MAKLTSRQRDKLPDSKFADKYLSLSALAASSRTVLSSASLRTMAIM